MTAKHSKLSLENFFPRVNLYCNLFRIEKIAQLYTKMSSMRIESFFHFLLTSLHCFRIYFISIDIFFYSFQNRFTKLSICKNHFQIVIFYAFWIMQCIFAINIISLNYMSLCFPSVWLCIWFAISHKFRRNYDQIKYFCCQCCSSFIRAANSLSPFPYIKETFDLSNAYISVEFCWKL